MLHVVEVGKDMPRILQELPPHLRDIQLAGKPLEQLHMIIFLDLRNGMADSRLRNIQLFRGRPHPPGFRHGDEDLQISDRHTLSPPLYIDKKP